MKPREKILHHGAQKLESWELISTILGSGVQGSSVFQISKKAAKILEEKKENISQKDLSSIPGIGTIKAMQIIAAFELARRYYIQDDIRIESAQDILDQSLTHPREIFTGAISDHASSLIVVHNHPSGNTYPSPTDVRTTKRIGEVAELVGIRLLDHVIIGATGYFSFKEHAMLM